MSYVLQLGDFLWIGIACLSFILILWTLERRILDEGKLKRIVVEEGLTKVLGESATSTILQHTDGGNAFLHLRAFEKKLRTIFGKRTGEAIVRTVVRREPTREVLLVAILLLFASISQIVSTEQWGELQKAVDQGGELSIVAALGILLIVLGQYPSRLSFISRYGSFVAGFLPFLLTLLQGILPLNDEYAKILILASLCSYLILVIYLVHYQIVRGHRSRRVLVVALGTFAGLAATGQFVAIIWTLTRPRVLYALSAIAALSFALTIYATILRYPFLELCLKKHVPRKDGPEEIVTLTPKLEKGTSYIFDDVDQALNAFYHLISAGAQGLFLTRSFPDTIRMKMDLKDTTIIWLTRENCHPEALGSSNIAIVAEVMRSFLDKSTDGVIYCDGLDYLVMSNGFERTLKWLYDLNDKVKSTKSLLILVSSPGCLNTREAALIERETKRFPQCQYRPVPSKFTDVPRAIKHPP